MIRPTRSTALCCASAVLIGAATTGVTQREAFARWRRPGVAAVAEKTTVASSGNRKRVSDVRVSLSEASGGPNLSRGDCVTVAAGDAAAYECGDLRLVHELPSTITMGKTRTPTLLYNSRFVSPVRLVQANITAPAGVDLYSVGTTLYVQPSPGAPEQVIGTHSFGTLSGGRTTRVSMPINVAALGTGAYHVRVAVTATASSGGTVAMGDTSTMAVVDRRASSFGSGWWLDGFEQLVPMDATHKLWIGGDGSTRVYTNVSGSVWIVTPTIDRPDTLMQVGSGWQRRLRNGAYVEFNAIGQHIATVSRTKERTSFGYDGADPRLLRTIALPAVSASPSYVFNYATGSAGQPALSQVVAPQANGVARNVAMSGGNSWFVITDPDGRSIIHYADAARIYYRADKRGYATWFGYDPESKTLASVYRDMAGTASENMQTTFCAGEATAIAPCRGIADIASVETTVDGPRTDVADVTRFGLSRFGSPSRITDAVGRVTLLERTDSRWPALVTALVQPNGFRTTATYNARALIATQTEVQPLAPYWNADATTVYTWNESSPYDQLELVVGPSGEVARYGYLKNGDREWEEDGRGAVSRARFTYNARQQVLTVTEPGSNGQSVLTYDGVLGNVLTTRTPLVPETRYHRDAIGRIDSTYTPIGGGRVRTASDKYDAMDRVVEHREIGPTVPYYIGDYGGEINDQSPAAVLRVLNEYDADGNLLSVTRRPEGYVPTLIVVQTLSWTYDAANRKVQALDARGLPENWTYDPAGNVRTWRTLRGTTTRFDYDALNRLITRTSDPVTYNPESVSGNGWQLSAWFPAFAPGYEFDQYYPRPAPSLTVPGDVVRFTYDITGGVATASNRNAFITRTYYPTGLLHDEVTNLASVDGGDYPGPASNLHHYSRSLWYDLSRRRVSRTDALPNCYCTQSYGYQPGTNLLTSTQDGSASASLGYDGAGRLSNFSIWDQGRWSGEVMTYDAAGRLVDRDVAGYRGTVFHDHLEYDDANRVTRATISSPMDESLSGTTTNAYSGLGALAGTVRVRNGLVIADRYRTDPLGNIATQETRNATLGPASLLTTYTYGQGEQQEWISSAPKNWLPGYNVPALGLDTTFMAYDQAGNRMFSRTTVAAYIGLGGGQPSDPHQPIECNPNEPPEDCIYYTSRRPGRVAGSAQAALKPSASASMDYGVNQGWRTGIAGLEWTWERYDSENRLAVSQRSFYTDDVTLRTVFMEYRYDPFGRRVVTRTRWDRHCGPDGMTSKCLPSIIRTVWDDDQVLTELRNSWVTQWTGADGLINMVQANPEAEYSIGDYGGAVRYSHVSGIDQPLMMWRSNFSGALVPHRSWRGFYEAGTMLGSDPGIAWPARALGAFGQHDGVEAPQIQETHWLGSLVGDRSEPSGLVYMRNRYYDPKSGRFTQPDPIGLAGGMGMYGFAGGDPVNFGDPLGLCPNPLAPGLGGLQCAVQDLWNGIKAGPSVLRQMGRVAVTNPIASAAVFGSLGEVASGLRIGAVAASPGRIVIGETASRVEAYAAQVRADIFKPKATDFIGMMRENSAWLRDKISDNYEVIDIGFDVRRTNRGPFYEAERKIIERTGAQPTRVSVP